MRTACLRLLYRVAWALLTVGMRVIPSRARGAKCVLTRGEEVLMVRHTYGWRRRWELPGGGVHRREQPQAAAHREAREELGLEDLELQPLTVVDLQMARRRVRLHCFWAELSEPVELRLDAVEIAEASWFPVAVLADRLPPYGVQIAEALARRGARAGAVG
jgi:ADP-ribose pyrophosphatase YjhB (NUDIX family)